MDFHVYIHDDPATAKRLDDLFTLLGALPAQETTLMTTVKDINDKVAALQVSVANETAVDASVLTLLGGLTASVAGLKQQLADAIAASDPAALQAVVDALGALATTTDANAAGLAAAVKANTPAA